MRAFAFIFALLGMPPTLAMADADAPLRFAPIPMVDKEHMLLAHIGPMRFMEEKTGRAIKLIHTKDYQTLIDMFRRDEIDLAYIGPVPYVMLRQGFDAATPLVRFLESDGRDSYTCAFVTFSPSAVDMAAMRGRRLALPDPLSTCGDIGMSAILGTTGISLMETQRSYVGRHNKVAMEVILGQADAGGMKTSIARQFASLGLRIIQESPPMPGFVLIANRHTVPDAVSRALTRAFLELRPGENAADADRVRDWGDSIRHGTTPAGNDDFRALREQWLSFKGGR